MFSLFSSTMKPEDKIKSLNQELDKLNNKLVAINLDIEKSSAEKVKIEEHLENLKKEVTKSNVEIKTSIQEKCKLENDNNALKKEKKKQEEALQKIVEKLKSTESDLKQYNKHNTIKKLSYTELEAQFYTGVFGFENGVKGYLEGWKLWDFSQDSLLNKELDLSKPFVSTTGLFGKGKTFVHSHICGIDLPHGVTYHTRGISTKILDKLVVLDSAGFQTPLDLNHTKRDIYLKKLDEDFLSNLIQSISDCFIFVVQHLTLPEQEILLKIKETIKSRNYEQKTCNIYIVHNFSDVWDEFDAENLWEEEVKSVFYGEFKKGKDDKPDTFTEIGEIPITHVCLFNHFSELGKNNNERVFRFLRDSISTIQFRVNRSSFITRLQKGIEILIPNFFSNSFDSKDKKVIIEPCTDENEKKKGVFGTVKIHQDMKQKNPEVNRYLDGYNGTILQAMNVGYVEYITEDKEYKLVLDTPGLDKDQKIKFSQTSEMELTEFKSVIGDDIKVGVMNVNNEFLEIHYERKNSEGIKRDMSRPEGIWRKKIEIPKEFRGFDKISIKPTSGYLVITVFKKEAIKQVD